MQPERLRRPRAGAFAAVLALAAAAVLVTLAASALGDYGEHPPVGGDNPGPAIRALLDGSFSQLAALQPLMGLGSIILRVPFAALGDLVGASPLRAYELGALPCVLAAAALGGLALARARPRAGLLAGVVLAALCVANPAGLQALGAGHPEELLAAALATGAAIAAAYQRPLAAGLALGLAVGTKQWALIAVPPVLIALRAGRLRALAPAIVTAVALSAPLPLANHHAFSAASRTVGSTHFANAYSAWWPVSHHVARPAAAPAAPSVRRMPGGLDRSAASLIVLAVVAVLGAIGLRRRAARPGDALALLAALALLRSLLDPLPLEYYAEPFLLALAGWEALERRGPPLATVLATALVWVAYEHPGPLGLSALNALVLVISLAFAAALLARGYAATGSGWSRTRS